MNDNVALNLVKKTFENSFDRENFLIFAKNLFHFLDTDSFIYSGNLIPDAFASHIKTLERIGKYEDSEGHKIDILAVQLDKQSSLERARTIQRNFIAWYLNGSRGGVEKDAALVAFYTKDSDDWRLSLVKMDYHLGESKAGKIKAVTDLTPARRFSFLVGANENTHTAQKQLLPILQDDEFKPRLADLESAFNVEIVTKDFFEKYKKLFLDTKDALDNMVDKDERIKDDFLEKNIDTADFAKKLLGQIVFLYFLQKKGWFGVARDSNWGTGPKDFLRQLFEKQITDYDNFFNNILEPLFYEALAIERPDDFYSRFDCKIPFLNGGLFDPLGNYDWVHTDIRLPDELFSNDRKTKEGDIGDGILDIFDRYNFTVKEDEPLEREVAVDPEMLGKVFENLLEVKDRKSKGTYYTPREIVHYMCQESLINYLVNECEEKVNRKDIETLIQYGESAVEHDSRVEQEGKETKTYSYKLPESIRKNAQLIDDKLKNIRVCDPAIGSGAFPVGMMNEIVRTRNTLTSYFDDKEDRSIYNFKRDAIQNSLYGVDIDPGAVEIAKLRLWLSLMVDEEDIKQIKPLPNLDYKIMQGNSLLEEFEGVKLFDDRLLNSNVPANDDQIKKLEVRKNEIEKSLMTYYQKNPLWLKNQKIERPTELYQLEGELKRVQLSVKDEKGIRFQIKDINQNALFGEEHKARKIWEELQSLQKEFFETTQKKEKDNLKKQIQKLEWELIEATLKEENKESSLKKLEQYKRANIKPFFLWKLHFSEVFQEKGGFDVIIANPPYVRADDPSIKDQRNAIMASKSFHTLWEKWDLYVAFIEKGFSLLAQNGILEFIISDAYMTSKYAEKSHEYFLQNSTINRINFCSDLKIFEAAVKNIIIEFKKVINPDHIPLRIKHKGGWDNLIVFPSKKQSEMGMSVFKLDGESKTIGNLSNTLTWGEICYVSYGIAQSSDEKKYKGEFTKEDVLSDTQDEIHPLGYIEGKYIESYAVRKIRYIEWGTKRSPKKWRRVTFPELYVPEKIMFGGMTGAIIDKKGLLCNHSMTVSVPWKDLTNVNNRSIEGSIKKDFHIKEILLFRKQLQENSELFGLKYLLAILNSKFAHKFLDSVRRSQIGFYPDDLKKLPIKKASENDQKPFVEIVDKILDYTKSENYLQDLSKQVKVKEYEGQIDQMVYKLYGLNDQEIKLIEEQ